MCLQCPASPYRWEAHNSYVKQAKVNTQCASNKQSPSEYPHQRVASQIFYQVPISRFFPWCTLPWMILVSTCCWEGLVTSPASPLLSCHVSINVIFRHLWSAPSHRARQSKSVYSVSVSRAVTRRALYSPWTSIPMWPKIWRRVQRSFLIQVSRV